jgi:excinuclease ABC subunit C
MSSNIAKLKKMASLAPNQPGIYFWWHGKEILYVGRATSLKNRLGQYFAKSIDRRIKEMVEQADNITYLVSESLLEAIVLEANNIKKYWPKYNIVDKDNRSFIYLTIDDKSSYPKLNIIRGNDLKKFPASGYKIFGPYQSYHLIYKALRILRRLFPYSLCKPDQGRACFDYQIGLCPGVCINEINSKKYKENIKNLTLFLSGKKRVY